jgi:nucleoid DNA-binding protein
VNKVDLIDVVYRTHGGISRQEAGELVDAIFRCVKSILGSERRMHVAGFGSFQVVTRGARAGRNPHTGQPLVLPDRRALVFRPAASLVDRLNGSPRLGPRRRSTRGEAVRIWME